MIKKVFVLCFALVCSGFISAQNQNELLGKNLIQNANAEIGKGLLDASSTLVSIPAWTRIGNASVLMYGASGGFPDLTSPGSLERGLQFFVGGASSEASSLVQTINLENAIKPISTGKLRFQLSGYLGGYESQNDYAEVTARFIDQYGKALKTARLTRVLAAERNNITGFVQRFVEGSVPSQTKRVVISIIMQRLAPSYNDGSADDLSFLLK